MFAQYYHLYLSSLNLFTSIFSLSLSICFLIPFTLTVASSLCFSLLYLTEDELASIETEPTVELANGWEDIGCYDVTGIALAGCPSAKDVARIASQKNIVKQDHNTSEEEEESTEEEEEEDEEEDPKATMEKRAQREIKLFTSKIKSFKWVRWSERAHKSYIFIFQNN